MSNHTQQLQTTSQGPRVGPYVFGRTLGTGSSSKVKLARNTDTGEIVAIKIVRKDFLDKKPSLKVKMRREISVLKLLSHPNLTSLIDVFEIHTHLFLVMEFVDGVELFDYLVHRGALRPEEALSFFQQIICGLDYCHKRLICHRDLKPENLLLDRNLNIKIADFGMTSLSRPGLFLDTSCGSPHYCDPMVVSGGKYDGLKADIWSCGVILYAMVTGRLPFDDDNIQHLLKKVQLGQYHMPNNLPADLKSLISGMLTLDPEQRITLEGIKAHPWFNSIPPKTKYVDNFVVPSESVPVPDNALVKSLVDLGWGDENQIREELSAPGGNILKVFYAQLERHPMSRRGGFRRQAQSDPAAVAEPIDDAPPRKTAPTPTVNHTQPQTTHAASTNGDASLPKLSAQPPSEVTVPLSSLTARLTINSSERDGKGEKHVTPAASSVSNGVRGNGRGEIHTSQSAPGWTGGLVRQSSYARPAEDESVADKDTEEALKNLSGEQPSWFDSVRNYFAGQGSANSERRTDDAGAPSAS